MANNYMGNMTFGVNFKVDTKALDQLNTYFTKLGQGLDGFENKAKGNNTLEIQAKEARKAYDQLYTAMVKAYNVKLGQFDLTKVNAGLKDAGTNLTSVVNKLGSAGQNVNTILSSFMGNKIMIKETSQFLDKMAVTFGNTVRWSITTKILNTITGSIQKAFYFTKDLDRSLNDIRIVTSKSADEMERFALQATNAAQALGRTTTDYTKASLLFYQQGLSDKEVAARTQTTLKAANVTGQSTSDVSEQLTAVWNGYKASAAETEKYVDKLSAVAASTASNLEELSTGMSKVASAANMMGVDIDQLNAQLSTIISVTRQAPETIGAAMKTVYSRMSTIQAGGIDEEDGATLTSYSAKMANFGISVLDANGKLRDMGEVIEEIGNKWESFSREAQIGLAQAMGGTRQYSNLTALFENWDKYQAALKTSQNATGTLQKQQDIYMDSLAAHFDELTAEAEKFYQSLIDEDAIKDFTDGIKFIVKEINGLVSGLGGGATAFTNFAFQIGTIFSKQIGTWIGTKVNNKAMWAEENTKMEAVQDVVNQAKAGNIGTWNSFKHGKIEVRKEVTAQDLVDEEGQNRGVEVMSQKVLQDQAIEQQKILDLKKSISTEDYNELSTLNEQIAVMKMKEETYAAVKDFVAKEAEASGEQLTVSEVLERLREIDLEELDKEIDKSEQLAKKEKDIANEKAKQLEITESLLAKKEEELKLAKEKYITEDYQKDAKKSLEQELSTLQTDLKDQNNRRKQLANIGIQGITQKDNDLLFGNYTNVFANGNKTIGIEKENANNKPLIDRLKYYQTILTKANELKLLNNEEYATLEKVNKTLANKKVQASSVYQILKNSRIIEEKIGVEINTQNNEYNVTKEKVENIKENIKDISKYIKSGPNDIANLEEEIEQLRQKIQDLIQEKTEADENADAYKEDELDTIEEREKAEIFKNKFQGFIPILEEIENADDIKNKNNLGNMQSDFNRKLGEQQRINRTQDTTRTLMASMQMLTGVIGALNTAFKDGATGMDRYNAGWAGLTSTVAGAASIIGGPMAGAIASMGVSAVRGIADLFGLDDVLSEIFASEQERYEKFQQELEETSKKVQQTKDDIEASSNATQTYHNTLKDLEAIREEWDKIAAKKKAGITLTSSEQQQYESLVNQMAEINPSIIQGYDEQHNAILNINTALDDTIAKLKDEYEWNTKNAESLPKHVDNLITDSFEAAKEITNKQKEYNSDRFNIQNQVTNELYNFINPNREALKTKLEDTYGKDIDFNDAIDQWINELQNIPDLLTEEENKMYNSLLHIGEQVRKGIITSGQEFADAYIKAIGTDEDAEKTAKSIREKISKQLQNYTTIGVITGGGFDNPLSDVFNDVVDKKSAMSYFNSENEQKKLDAINEIYTMANTFGTAIRGDRKNLERLDQIPKDLQNSLISVVQHNLTKKADEIAANPDLYNDDNNKADKLMQDGMNTIFDIIKYSSVEAVNQYSLNLSKAGKIQSNKAKYSIEEYVEQIDLLSKTLKEVAKNLGFETEEDIDTFVKSVLGSDYDDTDLQYAMRKNGIANKVSAKDKEKYEAFAKATEDYSGYGEDKLLQFEGFKHENYGTALFHEAYSDINSQLNEIKNTALDGSALDEEKFENLNSQLFEYQGHLQNVQTEVEILNDKNLYGTQVWMESLKRIEQELQKAQEKALLTSREKAYLEIQANLNTTEVDEAIDKLMSKDYEITFDIKTQGDNTYNDAIKDLENLKTALGYVGEEGQVAADKVLDLLNAFPELNGMIKEFNSDGTLTLTQEQIDLIKERTKVDIAGTVSAAEMELQTQLNRAIREEELTKRQIELTETELKNYAETEEHKSEFVEDFAKLYGEYSDAQVQITDENNNLIITDTWNTADQITNYWVDAYANADTAYKQFVQDVINGNKVLTGKLSAENFDPDSTITNSGIRKLKLDANSKTLSQDILDKVNATTDSASYKEALEETLAALQSKYQLQTTVTEGLKNEMLALMAAGADATKNADNLGKKTKEAAWQAKDLYDYYHKVNKELEFISQKLTVLQKQQKFLKDEALLKNLKLQTAEYENQIKYLQEKRAIQAGYDEELRTRETNAEGKKGLSQYGIKFDENGNITNYAEIAKALQEGQNSKESVEDYENFNNEVKRYEENHKLMLELESQLYDAISKRQELQAKAIEARLEMILDVSKAEKQMVEFKKKLGSFKVDLIINPDQTTVDAAVAQAATSFINSAIAALPEMNTLLTEGNEKYKLLSSGQESSVVWNGNTYNTENMQQLKADITSVSNKIQENVQDIQQAYQGTLDSYSNALKELNDWDKRVLQKYEMVHSVYDHAEKLTKLWYGEDSLEAKSMLANLQRDKTSTTRKETLEANKQVEEDWQRFEEARATGNEKLANEAYDAWAESVSKLQNLTEQYAEERKQLYLQEIDLASKVVEIQLFKGQDREEFISSWEMINKQAEIYLDTINAQFGVQQLENKYMQAYNKMVGNTKAQKQLNTLMEQELGMLKEKDKLTKYDLERAEARYDLALKQMALDEARENKTNLRLRRDSQGNYTYQYTANQDDILKAESDLAISENNLYNMDRDRVNDLTQNILDAESEYQQKFKEICETYADDAEKRNEALNKLDNDYFGEGGILSGYLKEYGTAYKNLEQSINFTLNGVGQGEGHTVLQSFEDLKENLPEKISELAPGVNAAVKPIIDAWIGKNGDGTGEDGLAGAYNILRSKTEKFGQEYSDAIASIASKLTSDDAFGKIRKTYEETKTAADNFREAAENSTTAIGALNSAGSEFSLNKLITDLSSVSDIFNGTDQNESLIKRINKANKALKRLCNPEQKVANLQKIRDELKLQRKALKKNEDKFKDSEEAANTWSKALIKSAKNATKEIDLVQKALDKITSKTVTVTVKTVYADQKGGGSDNSGGGGGSNPEKDDDKIKLDDYNDQPDPTPVYVVQPSQGDTQRIFFAKESDAELYKNSLSSTAISYQTTYGTLKNTGLKEIQLQKVKTGMGGIFSSLMKDKTIKLETGGYTGAWGDQGKLAMLHEKELVLNKDDTKNMLQMVDIIRQIDIGRLESNMLDTFFTMQQKLKDSSMAPDSQPAVTNQNIIINADFPDATDRDEIKAAFDSIVNMASQRAFTKKY